MTDATHQESTAGRVVVSYPTDSGDWVGRELHRAAYIGYLRTVRAGPVEAGDRWEEFVSRGCGIPLDVELVVESVVDGSTLGADTEIRFVRR